MELMKFNNRNRVCSVCKQQLEEFMSDGAKREEWHKTQAKAWMKSTIPCLPKKVNLPCSSSVLLTCSMRSARASPTASCSETGRANAHARTSSIADNNISLNSARKYKGSERSSNLAIQNDSRYWWNWGIYAWLTIIKSFSRTWWCFSDAEHTRFILRQPGKFSIVSQRNTLNVQGLEGGSKVLLNALIFHILGRRCMLRGIERCGVLAGSHGIYVRSCVRQDQTVAHCNTLGLLPPRINTKYPARCVQRSPSWRNCCNSQYTPLKFSL